MAHNHCRWSLWPLSWPLDSRNPFVVPSRLLSQCQALRQPLASTCPSSCWWNSCGNYFCRLCQLYLAVGVILWWSYAVIVSNLILLIAELEAQESLCDIAGSSLCPGFLCVVVTGPRREMVSPCKAVERPIVWYNQICYVLGTGSIKLFVLDEADEMLSRGFKDQIHDVFKQLNAEVQVMCYMHYGVDFK